MTNLECNVSTCAHFDDYRCKKDKILVKGNDATSDTQTCCASYDRASSNIQNSAEEQCPAKPDAHIECDACLCDFNDNGKCDADAICVDCCQCHEPQYEGETMCAKFHCDCR